MATQTLDKPNVSKHKFNLFLATAAFATDPNKNTISFKDEVVSKHQVIIELRELLSNYPKIQTLNNEEFITYIAKQRRTDPILASLFDAAYQESLHPAQDKQEKGEDKKEEKQIEEKKPLTSGTHTKTEETATVLKTHDDQRPPQTGDAQIQLSPTTPTSQNTVRNPPPIAIAQAPSQASTIIQQSTSPAPEAAKFTPAPTYTQESIQNEPTYQPQPDFPTTSSSQEDSHPSSRYRRPQIPQSDKNWGNQAGKKLVHQSRMLGNKLGNKALNGAKTLGNNLVKSGLRTGLNAGAKRLATQAAIRAGGAALLGVGWPIIIAIVVVIVLLIVMLGLLDTTALLSPYSQTPQTQNGGSTSTTGANASSLLGVCPTREILAQNANTSCKYLNPNIDLFNTDISASAIQAYIEKYYTDFNGTKSEFSRRVNYIVDSAKQGGLNPALFLGYWKSESKFSSIGSRHMGCAGDTFEEEVNCALGIREFNNPAKNPVANCARSKSADSIACLALKSIRTQNGYDTAHPVKYPISTIDDFAESYGPYAHLTGGQPTNCMHTYNTLLGVAAELNVCTAPSSPIQAPAGDLQQTILTQFGVTMSGFSDTQLQWAWEQLARLSSTNFTNLARGTKITKIPGFVSEQTNCRSVNLGDYQDKTLFQVTITHELGHIIYWCNANDKNYKTEHSKAFDIEGGVTGYAQFAYECYKSTSITEDYAETTAYYLNPGIVEQTRCHNRGQAPFGNSRYPMHYNVGTSIYGKL